MTDHTSSDEYEPDRSDMAFDERPTRADDKAAEADLDELLAQQDDAGDAQPDDDQDYDPRDEPEGGDR
jgi:hypothetical protein